MRKDLRVSKLNSWIDEADFLDRKTPQLLN